jgi:glycosyltransferase involved in cell wall biosynthesis
MGVLAEKLLEAGHVVLLLVAPIDAAHPDVNRLATMGVKITLLPEPPQAYVRLAKLRGALSQAVRPRASLLRILEDFGTEHLFLNQGGTWDAMQIDFLECVSAFDSRYSLICHLNQPKPGFSSEQLRLARQIIGRASRVFFNSEWTRRLTEVQISMAVPSAVYFQLPIRFQFDSPLSWPASRLPRIAMVNRLDTYHKGIDIAFQAIARLRQEGMRIQLGMYGSGPEEAYLRELVRFLCIDDSVTFHGYTNNLADVWLNEEMLLLPSRHEGSPVAVIEAMGFGRPVLRTPYGGVAEWIRDGENGYICPAAETDLLCQTLRRALSERYRWAKMGRNAYELVKQAIDLNPAQVFLQALDK